MGTTSVIISNPQSNPQCMMSCTTSAYFGSPRGLLSCCKAYPCHLDTVEVCGSSPHGPTIIFNTLAGVGRNPHQNFTCNSSPVNWQDWPRAACYFRSSSEKMSDGRGLWKPERW